MDPLSLLNFQIACQTLILANCLFFRRKKIIVRRWWERRILKRRDKEGAYKKQFLYYKKYDHEEFYKFVGMTVPQFNYLNRMTRVKLQKFSYRKSLHHQLKLSAVLNFLVNGGSVTRQSWFFLIGRSTMYKIIPEVCQAICEALHGWVSFPKGDEWVKNAEAFYNMFDFPNVVGIIDGKHVPIKAPPKSGAWFRNFKQNYSINLMAACDAHGKFMWVSIGDFGSKNDAGNFIHSSLGMALAKDEINFPDAGIIPSSRTKCPFFFLADGGFALHRHIMTPYKKNKSKQMPLMCKVFNIRLQHPRKTIERAFGIMCKKFQVLNNKLDFQLKTIDLIVFTVVHLYNYLLSETNIISECSNNSSEFDNNDSSMDAQSDDGDSTSTDSSINSSISVNEDESSISTTISEETNSESECNINFDNAEEIRTFLSEYFITAEGYVTWQFDKLS